jgi:hypothetical protein
MGLVVAALLSALATFGCAQDGGQAAQDAGEDGVVYTSYEDQNLGLAVEAPQDWVTHQAFSGLTVASSQEVIERDSLADIEDGAFVNIIPGELAVFGMQAGETFSSDQPAQVLGVYRGLLENEGQTFMMRRPPQTRTVNGQNVAQMTVESDVDGERLVTIFSVIINDEFMAIVSAGALQARFDDVEPVLTHIVDSIVVSPPAEFGG